MITIQTGRNGMEVWQANIAFLANPSKENKDRLDTINNKIMNENNIAQVMNKSKFIILYGKEMLDFILSISNISYSLFVGVAPFNFSWEVKWDSENDDYWMIYFRNGKFFYVKEVCAGYATREMLEEDISKERVLELLKK